MKLNIQNTEGTDTADTVELKDSIFAIEPNKTLLYEDVRRIQTNKRNGNASTKERGQVRGGGRKAYRQKGTGMARRGSIRSPLLKGGGTTHGPQPRDYYHGLPKKMRRAARKSALSLKASDENFIIIDEITIDAPKTKELWQILELFELTDKKVLLLTPDYDKNIYLSSRNIPNLTVEIASNINTYQIMHADVILVLKKAVDILQNSIEPEIETAEE